MKNPEPVTRREFTLASALAMLSGVSITIAGCGASEPASPSPTTTTTPTTTTPPSGGMDVIGAVSANHGHRAVITAAELTEGDALTLDITGDSDHPHAVELSAADLDQIEAGMRVSRTSSTEASSSFASHSHSVTFN